MAKLAINNALHQRCAFLLGHARNERQLRVGLQLDGLAGLVLRLGRLRLEERILLDLSLAGNQLLQAVVFRDL